MSRDVRAEVEAMPWPDVIGEIEPPAEARPHDRVGELTRERDLLAERCERLAGRVMFWKRQADAWRLLAGIFGVAFVALGAWLVLA
jgi:hypothetical protein